MDTGNRGEWSELYALASLLSDGKLNIANEDLSKENNYYEIARIITSSESEDKQVYQIENEEEVILLDPETGKEDVIKRIVVRNKIGEFLKEIIKGSRGNRAFSSRIGSYIKKNLKLKRLSATSTQRADFIIEAYEPKFQRVIESGYSIKSQLGAASTLFNASQATNINYHIKGLKRQDVDLINKLKSCRGRVRKIYELGGGLVFNGTKNDVFRLNLMLVDGYFPKILADALIIYYLSDKRSMDGVIKELAKIKNEELQIEDMTTYLTNNFKKFLFYSALGMVAKKPWDGIAISTGGVIIIKRNGEVVGYTPYNINLFQDYLLKSTKFDSPDSQRNRYGTIYEESGNYYMNLNFQIRFAH